ncbi:3'-5' exonuclease family protein [Acinetobacter shaoyimingii]|uniref:hypothetical protein n=1 Tax=Acinetobacter shaoyimingii TaxID=2715164 RepID=UPI0022305766|nr:hypothetical protein [Acinetobacter shaoyimingii]
MAYIMVDIEADGPIPGDYSMIALGAVLVEDNLHQQFYSLLKPISDQYIPQALTVSDFSREDTLNFNNPEHVMKDFTAWIAKVSPDRPIFISDNHGFDWMFVCWYFTSQEVIRLG